MSPSSVLQKLSPFRKKVYARRRTLLPVALGVAVLAAVAAVPKPPLQRGVALSHAVYDRHDRLLRLNIARDHKIRLWVPLEKQSPLLVRATLLKEDRHFYFHPGVNPLSLVRATWSTFVSRERRLGGSTLTMQLARIRYGLETRSFFGKIRQIATAFRLELFYSKRDILEAYLNIAPYGGNIEGAAAASLLYFGKQPHQLTDAEAIALAVLPQRPGRSVGAGWPAAYQTLRAVWIADGKPGAQKPGALPAIRNEPMPFLAPHFSEAMMADHPEVSVLNTTLDLRLQQFLERQMDRYILRRKDAGIRNAAAMIVDTRTMDLRAMVGSADYFSNAINGQVNGARAARSPGSTLKPFVYALAMEQGLIHPQSMLKDAPAAFGGFNPENFDGEFAGPLPAGEALRRSRNVPAVYLASRLEAPGLYGFLKRAHVSLPFDQAHYGMALTLGGSETTMEDLARLYAMLANKGELKPLRTLIGETAADAEPILTPESCYLVMHALSVAPRPDQRYRDQWTPERVSVAWKTGTSYGFRDAWTAGVIGPYVLVVWVGNFSGEGNPAFVGGTAAAPLFFDVADGLKARPEARAFVRWPQIPEVKKVRVCSVSGQMPTGNCPHETETWFIPGKSPIAACTIHRAVQIDVATGRRACPDSTRPQRAEVFEFWPSDLLAIYRMAGVPRRVPPPFEDACANSARDAGGLAPQITSPRRGIGYTFRVNSPDRPRIPLKAIFDADVHAIHWFVNQKYLGQSSGSGPMFWSPEPGRYVVRAVDDQGRSDATSVTVEAVE